MTGRTRSLMPRKVNVSNAACWCVSAQCLHADVTQASSQAPHDHSVQSWFASRFTSSCVETSVTARVEQAHIPQRVRHRHRAWPSTRARTKQRVVSDTVNVDVLDFCDLS